MNCRNCSVCRRITKMFSERSLRRMYFLVKLSNLTPKHVKNDTITISRNKKKYLENGKRYRGKNHINQNKRRNKIFFCGP